MRPLTLERLQQLLASFPRLSIGLLGDLFLDRYLEIDASRREMSIETGLEAYQVIHVRNSAGALGTVLNNLAALGVGRLVPVTVIGDDGHGDDLLRSLAGLPVETSHILRRPERLTPTYTKPLRRDEAGKWQELHRLDVRSREPLSAGAHAELLRQLRDVFATCDGWIVLDQVPETDCGVVDGRMRGQLQQLTRELPDKVLLADSRKHLGDFGCGILKGNRDEFLQAAVAGTGADDPAVLHRATRALAARTGQPAFCTVGERGMLVAESSGALTRVAGFPVSGPIDIVGAGDAATSGIVTTLLASGSLIEAALVANLAASITIQQIGTTGVAPPGELLARFARLGCPDTEAL